MVTSAIPEEELARPPAEIAHDHLALWFENRLNVMGHFTPWRWRPEAELRGFERLREATQDGRGAVLWIADFALQSPFLYAVLARHGIRLSHFSAPGHGYSTTLFGRTCLNPILTSVESRYLAERIMMLDRALPTEIRVLAAMRRLKKRLLEGRVVSVSALSNDWGPVHVRILNGKTRLAYGAPGLAHNTGVPVFPVFATREPDGRNTVTIEAPLQFRSANAREAAIQATHDYAAILDGYIRRYPEQWRGWKYYVTGAPAKSSP
jgi:lauroyl/myristoyl acyltransferase